MKPLHERWETSNNEGESGEDAYCREENHKLEQEYIRICISAEKILKEKPYDILISNLVICQEAIKKENQQFL